MRIGRNYASTSFDISPKIISGFLSSNLEDMLVAVNDADENTTLPQLLAHARAVKRQKLGKEDKRRVIIDGLQNEPKVRRRYLRGYPQK